MKYTRHLSKKNAQTAFLNIFVQDTCNKTLLHLKSHDDPHTLIVGDFNSPLSLVGMCSRQSLDREMVESNVIIDKADLTDQILTEHYRIITLNIIL